MSVRDTLENAAPHSLVIIRIEEPVALFEVILVDVLQLGTQPLPLVRQLLEGGGLQLLVCIVADEEEVVALLGPGALDVHRRVVMSVSVRGNDAEDAPPWQLPRPLQLPSGCLLLQQKRCQHTERGQHGDPVKCGADE